ncbi:MAG: low molecular weight protein-tyrosine-phosphatase [Candidatus Sericytochromatia bacterium]
MIQVLFVCLGNICRSPMAEGIFQALLQTQGLEQFMGCDSAGTANYHSGLAPDHRTLKVLKNRGIHTPHRARQVLHSDFQTFDFIVAMDDSNHHHLQRMYQSLQNPSSQILRMIDFVSPEDNPRAYREIPDPYYGDLKDFEEVFELLSPGCQALLKHIQRPEPSA